MLNPEMPAQQLRLHMGELTASEIRVARAAIAWANTAAQAQAAEVRRQTIAECAKIADTFSLVEPPSSYWSGYHHGREEAATRIRALTDAAKEDRT